MAASTVTETARFLRCPYGQQYPLWWFERITRGINAGRHGEPV